jgi:hypothetical protein
MQAQASLKVLCGTCHNFASPEIHGTQSTTVLPFNSRKRQCQTTAFICKVKDGHHFQEHNHEGALSIH